MTSGKRRGMRHSQRGVSGHPGRQSGCVEGTPRLLLDAP
jgi:hypothetical protein